jgi:alpha-D-xyloside xylohydrolase
MSIPKNRAAFFPVLILLLNSFSYAQNWSNTENGIRITINHIVTEIRYYTPSTIRIIKYPEGVLLNKQSLSVIASPLPVKFSTRKHSDQLSLSTDKITVTQNLKTGAISFSGKPGKRLLIEKPNSVAFTPFNDAGEKTFSVGQSFELEKEEAIYGLGQQQQGKMIQRNLTLKMIQGNTDDYTPFFISAKGYAVFWDNYSPTVFSDNPDSTSFKSEVGDCIDYYFMGGDNADGVISELRNLTGKVPMMPLWTFGYWQSRERYKTQNELLDVVKKYRQQGVPLDGIIQDWQYWGNNYLWNAMEFLNVDFSNPQQMINEVHGLNAHLAISIWNSFGPQTKQYKELEKAGALLDFKTWPESGSEKWPPNKDYPSGVRVYDPYNPAARAIYWKYLNQGLLSLGIDAWWMDSSEPDHMQSKPEDFDNKTFLGSFRKVRNAFPLMTVGGVSENQRRVTRDKRVFILTRSAFTGQQRYGANTWSGDVNASWTALRNQISAGLNFSLTGIPYWNSDIGGFFLWNFKNPLTNPDYRELYTRWLQFGTFCPMMRSHGTDAPREIYQFGNRGNKVYDAVEKYIKLRYSLLPYIYSTSWEVSNHNSSMMRALMMDFPSDRQALDINDEYLFGKSLLVAPVTEKMYVRPVSINGKDTTYTEDFSTIKKKAVYLPAGCNWSDFWTGEQYPGGQMISKETPLDIIPLFVRAGAILPLGPDVQYATEKKWDNLEIRVYPGADGQFVLYEDENDNYNYEKEMFSTIVFNWNDRKKELTIQNRTGSFPGMLEHRNFHVVLVNNKTIPNASKTIEFTGIKAAVSFK